MAGIFYLRGSELLSTISMLDCRSECVGALVLFSALKF